MIDITKFEGHTAGPWVHAEVLANAAGFAVECMDGRQLARVMKTHGVERLPSRANAQLIAAAPELLAEVIRLRAALEGIATHLSSEVAQTGNVIAWRPIKPCRCGPDGCSVGDCKGRSHGNL